MAYSFSNFFKSIGSAFKPPTTPLYNPLAQKPRTTVPQAPISGPMSPYDPQTAFVPPTIPQVKAPTAAPTPAITPTLTPQTPVLPAITPTPTLPPASAITTPTAPALPTITPETQAAYIAANKAVEDAMRISPEELSTQGDIDKLIESTKTAYRNTSDQPIPMEFITGQLASIERRATGLAEPLERKLSRLQASRTASLEASRFKLEQTGKRLTEERESEKTARIEAESARRFGIEQAGKDQGFTLGKGEVRYDPQGNVIASRVGSEGLSDGFGTGYTRGQNPTVDSYVDLINSGQYKPSDVPADLKIAVTNALAAGGAKTNAVKTEMLQDKIDQISGLLNHRGMSKSVGPTGIARWTPFKIDTWTGDVQDFVAGVHQLTSKETLQFLIDVKSAGATFGALSNQELQVLSESATRINDWEIKDKQGNGIGKWNIGESQFKNELAKIQELAKRAFQRAGGSGGNIVTAPDGTEVEIID